MKRAMEAHLSSVLRRGKACARRIILCAWVAGGSAPLYAQTPTPAGATNGPASEPATGTPAEAQATPATGAPAAAGQAPAATAQPRPTAGPPAYRPLIEEAVAEFAAGHFAEARALFARAHAAYPNARTHRGLGLAEFELRNYGASIRQLQAALASTVKPLDAALRADTEQLLGRARAFVAQVVIDARPPASRVLLDGTPVAGLSRQPFFVTVGEHVVQIEAAAHLPEKRKLSVRGGETLTLDVLLNPANAALQPPAATDDDAWYESPWLWAAVGAVTVGAVATGIALGSGSDTIEDPWGGSSGVVITGPSASP